MGQIWDALLPTIFLPNLEGLLGLIKERTNLPDMAFRPLPKKHTRGRRIGPVLQVVIKISFD